VKPRLTGIAILILFGIVRMPIESALHQKQRELHYHGATLNLDVRQQLGQLGFIAALGGFRALVADVLWLQAHSAWQRTEWGRMKVMFDAITALQPRNVMFWDMAAWHMHTNASVAAREDQSQPREALRLKAEMEYWRLGEDYLRRGIQNNPDRAKLYEELGRLRSDRFKARFNDPAIAAWAYGEAAKRPDAMPYVHRFALYELSKVPGQERAAYEGLKALFLKSENERTPTLEKILGEMEEKLSIPADLRLIKRDSPPHK
jgi:hypothetical protein